MAFLKSMWLTGDLLTLGLLRAEVVSMVLGSPQAQQLLTEGRLVLERWVWEGSQPG